MTGSALAMNPQVTAGLISGGVALAVAVLGIAGAIVAQTFAARRAFENSLAVFEREHAAQERQQQEQARRDDAYRFAQQRRSTYGRFGSLSREFTDAVDTERTAVKNLERIGRQRDRTRSSSADLETSAETAEQLVANAQERKRRLERECGTAHEEIYLLGSPEVRQAADQLWNAARQATHSASGDYLAARATFLDAVRQELGISPLPPLP